jgi:superkiller protein 3
MLKVLRPILAVLLLAAAVPAAADETPARQAYFRGVDELQRAIQEPTRPQQVKLWKSAEDSFREAIKLKTDYAEAYDKLGQALFNQGKVFDSITEFKNAVDIDPRLTEAWYDLGFAFENITTEEKLKDDEKTRKKLAKTNVKDAEAAYRKALEVQPENDIPARARSHFRLGVLLRDEAVKAGQGDAANLKEAMLHLEAANKLDTDYPAARNELGRLYDIIGRYPEAVEQYDLAIRGDKNYAEAYSNRGVAYWKQGNWDNALRDTLKATEVDPRFAGGHYNFAEVIFARIQELRLKGGDGDRSVIHLEAQKAVDEYRVATELDPDFMPAWYGLAKAYQGYHDFDKAAATYEKILEKDKRQKQAKALLKALKKEEQGFEKHIPKQYREDQKGK